MDVWLIEDINMERVQALSTFFMLRNDRGHIVVMVAKITTLCCFSKANIRLGLLEGQLSLNRCMVNHSDEVDIFMGMTDYIAVVEYIDLHRGRWEEDYFKASDSEYDGYRKMAGDMIWAVNGTLSLLPFCRKQYIDGDSTTYRRHIIF